VTRGPAELAAILTAEVYNALWAYCRRVCRERESAEDLLQDTLAHALLRLRQLRDPLALRPWLLAIARSLHLRRLRRERFRNIRATQEPVTELGLDPLHVALRRLPATQRELLELYYIDGLSLGETAQVLRCKPNTLKQRLLRARAALRRELERTLAPGELAAWL
jgi:RNA polymerase sigma factor (sigma-70 family)